MYGQGPWSIASAIVQAGLPLREEECAQSRYVLLVDPCAGRRDVDPHYPQRERVEPADSFESMTKALLSATTKLTGDRL